MADTSWVDFREDRPHAFPLFSLQRSDDLIQLRLTQVEPNITLDEDKAPVCDLLHRFDVLAVLIVYVIETGLFRVEDLLAKLEEVREVACLDVF